MKKLIILLISFNVYSQQVDKVAHFGVGYVAQLFWVVCLGVLRFVIQLEKLFDYVSKCRMVFKKH